MLPLFETMDFQSGDVRCCGSGTGEHYEEDMLLVESPHRAALELGWYGAESGFIIPLTRDGA